MRHSFACFTLALTLSCVGAQGQSMSPSPASLTVIRAGTLIDGVSESPRKNQLIFVRGERIEKVAEGSAAIPSGAKVIDLSAATVLPGLIDSHTHIFLWGEDPAKGGYDENILKAGIALRAAHWSKASPPSAIWKRKARVTVILKSNKPSKKAPFAARAFLARRARFPPPAETNGKATRANLTCPRARKPSTAQGKPAKPGGGSLGSRPDGL